MAQNKKPNLFIVGHPRCGTTSLHVMLRQHPEIFMSKEKELRYFNKKSSEKKQSEKEYLKNFEEFDGEKIRGESTPNYIYSNTAPREIKKFNPGVKIVVILREPVDLLRAWYQKKIESGNEKFRDIEKNIWKPEYQEMVSYSGQIRRYLKEFPKKNIHIIIYEDFKKDNFREYKKVCRFLGVDEKFEPEKEKTNPRFNRFGKAGLLLKSKTSVKIRKTIKKPLPKSIKRPLVEFYRKIVYIKGKIQIPEKTKNQLSKKLKPEVEKVDKLLHKEGFLDKNRNIVKEWGYDKV